MKKLALYLFLLTIAHNSYGQKIENIALQLADKNIVLSFDLLPQESINEQYDLVIKSSKDGYNKPLILINGNAESVEPKNRLQYTISGVDNFAGFKGSLDFQIEATLVFSPLRFLSPNEKVSVKKGKSMRLAWKGGVSGEKYDLDLYKSGVKLSTIESNYSISNTIWNVPSSTQKGSDYTIRLKGSNGQTAFTKKIAVKSKIPIIVKLLPLVLAGGIVAVLTGGGSGDTPAVDTTENLPDPPETPD